MSREPLFLTFALFREVFKRYRRKLLIVALLVGLAAFFLLTLRTPRYCAMATFRQASLNNGDANGLKSLFRNFQLASEDSEAIPLMLSRKLLSDAVIELGMQAHVKEKGLIATLVSNARKNLLREVGAIPAIEEEFVFRRVYFEQELPKRYLLCFEDRNRFHLRSKEGESLAQGEVGAPLCVAGVAFTLVKAPAEIEAGRAYPLTFEPMEYTLKSLLGSLEIKPSQLSPRLLKLSYAHPSRGQAMALLGELMGSYQRFLLIENEESAARQLALLEERRSLLVADLKSNLQEYARYMRKSLQESGFLGLSESIETTARPLESRYLERLSEIKHEKKRFERKLQTNPTAFFPVSESSSALKEFHGVSEETTTTLFEKYHGELDALQVRIRQLEHLRRQLELPGFEVSSLGVLLHDSVSQELIRKASDLGLALYDEDNRSGREQERIKESLATQKRFLQQHLVEMVELERVKKRVLEEKLFSLKAEALHLLEGEETQLVLELGSFREQISRLPEKWLLENELNFKKKLAMSVIDAMTQLTESKVVQQQLFQVESKPLDTPYAPIRPEWPALMLLALLVAIGTFSALFLFYTIRASLAAQLPQ